MRTASRIGRHDCDYGLWVGMSVSMEGAKWKLVLHVKTSYLMDAGASRLAQAQAPLRTLLSTQTPEPEPATLWLSQASCEQTYIHTTCVSPLRRR